MGKIVSEPMPWSPESTQFRDLQVKSEKEFNERMEEKKEELTLIINDGTVDKKIKPNADT